MQRLRWSGWRRGLLLAALPAAAFVGQLGFRVVYYDAWIPNTALVKVAFTIDRLRGGGAYVLAAALSTILIVVVALVPVIVGARRRGPRWRLAVLAWIVGIGWAAYVVFIGGDIFPAHRHWLPTLVALCMAAGLGGCLLSSARWPRAEWIALGVGVVAVVLFGLRQPRDRENRRAVTERWEYNGEAVGRLLHDAFGDRQPLLAAATVGSLCYHAKLPGLDMLGLNDRTIASRRPDDFGTGMIGHELGDGVYAMSRRPDLVVFCGPTGRQKPCSRGEKEMVELPEFRREYQLVQFRATDPVEVTARVWVRRMGTVGIEIESGGNGVVVPGFLFRGYRAERAEQDRDGRMGLRVPAGVEASTGVEVGKGQWRMKVESDVVPGRAWVRVAGKRISGEGGEVAFESAGDEVRIGVRAGEKMHLRRVVLVRDR